MKKYIIISIYFIFSLFSSFAKNNIILKVKEYSTEDGLSHRVITTIMQSKTGMMWFATWNGLNSFDGQNFRVYKLNDSISNNRIDKINELDDGTICCRMYNDKFYLFNPRTESFQEYHHEKGELFSRSRNDKYSIEYKDSTLFFSNRETKENYTYHIGANIAITKGVHRYFTDRQDNIWLNFNDRLYCFNIINTNYEFHKYWRDRLPVKGEVRALARDLKGRLWVGSKDGYIGLYSEENRFIGFINPEGKLSEKSQDFPLPYDIFVDRDSCIWVGTKGGGLIRFRENPSGNDFSAHSFCEGSKPENISNNNIYSILQDTDGKIWVGTYGGGLNIITENNNAFTVNQCDRNSILQESRFGIRIRHITRISQQEIAAATTNGILIYDNKGKFIQKIGSQNAMNIYTASDGKIYVGTMGNGLNILRKEKEHWNLLTYKSPNVEIPDVILSITEDYSGDLWLVSDNYLTKLMAEQEVSVKYGREFFNRSIVFSECVPLFNEKEELMVGTSEGYIQLNCAKVKKSDDIAPLNISAIKVDGQNYVCNGEANYTDVITIESSYKNISFEFSTLDYINPKDIRYAYRIIETDTSWVNIKSQHFITLNNLRSGKNYTLQLRSTNSDCVWINNQRTLSIQVRASLWSRFGMWLIVIVIIAAFFIYRRNSRKEQVSESTDQPAQHSYDISPAQPAIVSQKDVFVKKAMEYMEANMDNTDLNVEDFADSLGYSRSGFYRLMKETLNIKPVDFIREVRIRRAVYLLESRQYNISQVAFMTGFNDSKYFSKVFKKEKGVTPTEYLANLDTSSQKNDSTDADNAENRES